MKCEEIKELMEEYVFGELSEGERSELEAHFKNCSVCRNDMEDMKASLDNIENELSHINIPDRLKDITFKERRNTLKMPVVKRFGIVAASIAVIFALTAYTPILAAIKENMPDVLRYFAFGDAGIIHSVEQGFGQHVDKSISENDITFKVFNVIADDARTEILFSIEYDGDEKIDNMSIGSEGFGIKNVFGKEINQNDRGYSYTFNDNKITGRYSTGPLGFLENTVNMSLTRLLLTNRKIMDIDMAIKGDMFDLDMMIDTGSYIVDTLKITNIGVDRDFFNIEYVTKMIDKEYDILRPRIILVNEDGTNVNINSSQMWTSMDEDFDRAKDTYNISGLNLQNLRLQVVYNEIAKVIDGDWNIDFKADMKLARKHTIKQKIDAKFTIEDMEYKIREIVFTPSQSQVYIESAVNSPRHMINFEDMILYNGSEALRFTSVDQSGPDITIYKFDPITDFENVRFAINGVNIMREVNETINLDDKNAGEDIPVTINGNEAVMTYRFKENNELEIRIISESGNFRSVNGAYIPGDNNERHFADEVDFFFPHYAGPDYEGSILKFKNVDERNVDLVITHINEYLKTDFEIVLK